MDSSIHLVPSGLATSGAPEPKTPQAANVMREMAIRITQTGGFFQILLFGGRLPTRILPGKRVALQLLSASGSLGSWLYDHSTTGLDFYVQVVGVK